MGREMICRMKAADFATMIVYAHLSAVLLDAHIVLSQQTHRGQHPKVIELQWQNVPLIDAVLVL
jgi:uncharacterized protein YdeI (YjbR/CyaY-like superfamily)